MSPRQWNKTSIEIKRAQSLDVHFMCNMLSEPNAETFEPLDVFVAEVIQELQSFDEGEGSELQSIKINLDPDEWRAYLAHVKASASEPEA
jgi:hypothetical protein